MQLIAGGESQTLEFKNNFAAEAIETLAAFANTAGGKVCIGVSDQGAVSGVSVQPESVQNWLNEIKTKTSPAIIPEATSVTIEGKTVVVLSIQEHPVKPVAVRGKYFKRVTNANHVLSTSEVVNMHLQSFNTSWDYHLNPQFRLEDISFEKVQIAIDGANSALRRITEDPLTFLLKNELIRNGEVTNAAFLLFTKEDSVLTTIELGRFQSNISIKDSARTKTDILTQVEDVLAFVKKHINKAIIITGEARNTERWQYPPEALREIIINMIVHRDYRASSDSIVKIFNHKIEFYNPGRLPDNITVEDLLSNNYKSSPRNKLIADFCKTLGLIEKYGSGIHRILYALEEAGLPMPTFQNISDGFMVTIYDAEYEDEEKTDTEQPAKKPFWETLKSLFA
ncbi:MAG: putative DNA binding domain-containing protein [Saprospiraceae bacterium]|nr:putative DNA binding domain-containing protein [Saprospiraceae bacterium]